MIICLNNRPLLRWLLLFSTLAWCLLYLSSAQAAVGFRAFAQNAIDTVPTTATITHIGAGNVSSLGDTCGTVTALPVAGNVGDMLIALVNSRDANSVLTQPGGAPLPPAGWASLYAKTYPGQNLKVRIYYRRASGTTPAADPISITQTANCRSLAARVSRFRNVHPTNSFYNIPISNSGGAGGCGTTTRCQNSNNIDTGTETGVAVNDMLLVASFVRDNSYICENADAGGGWNPSFETRLSPGRDQAFGLHYQRATTTGSKSISNWSIDTGSPTCSSPDTDHNFGIIFALRPAPLIGAPGLTINVPTGTIADDVMIASIATRPSSIAISTPAGWTLVRTVTQPNANSSVLRTFYKVAGASEPANYTWTFSGAGFTGAAGGITSFVGVDTTTPIDAELGQPTANGTSHTAPTITTTQNGGMLVTVHEYTSSRAWTPPAGMTEAVDISSKPSNNAAGIAMEMNYEARPTAGATGPRTATTGGDADVGATQSVSLKPAPPPPPQLLAYYRMDELSWNGSAGEVADWSGNGRHGTAVDGISTSSARPVVPGTPGTCRYAEIPENNADNTTEAIDTGVNINNGVGNTGSISFWFKSNVDWNGGNNRQLVDASTTANGQKYFFLQVRDNSRLRFSLEDDNDAGFRLETATNTIIAGEWKHVAITWDLPNDTMQIYIGGSLAAENTSTDITTTGALGGLDTIYLGDNRSTYFADGSTNRSANGSIDEARIYNFVQTPTQIQADMNATHPCGVGTLDHFDIIVPVYGSVCNTNNSAITVLAKDFLGNTVIDYVGSINLSTSNGLGDWTLVTGNGILNNGTADDGLATYQFVATDNGIVVLDLGMSADADVSITVRNIPTGVLSTSATIDFRRANRSLVVTTDPIQIAGRPQAMTVARLDNNCNIDTGYNNNRDIRAWITRDIDDPNGIAPSIKGVALLNADPGFNNLTGANQFVFVNGVAAFNLDTTDVGKYILNIRDGNRRGSSDSITTRPFGFAFTDIRNPGVDGIYGTILMPGDDVLNPGGTANSGVGFVAAEENFRATLGAYLWQGTDDNINNINGTTNLLGDGIPDNLTSNLSNNGLTPAYNWDTTLSPLLDTPASLSGGMLGNLAPAIAAIGDFAGGDVDIIMAYSEVGSILLQADASDYLNSPGVNITGTSRYDGSNGVVGRFYPDHFTLTSSAITPSCVITDPMDPLIFLNTPFTYMGQPALNISYTLEARSLNNNKTNNYDTMAGYKTTDPMGNDTLSLHAEDNNDGVDMTMRVNSIAGNWGAGVYDINDLAASFARAATLPDGPYQSLQLSLQMKDEFDGRDIVGRDQRPGADNDCAIDSNCDSIAIGMPTDVRFGRFQIGNAYGSELLPLAIPLSTEYYVSDGADGGFVTNPDDACTRYDAASNPAATANNLVFSNYLGSLGAGEIAATVNMPPVDLISGLSDPAKPLVLHLPADVTLGPGAGNDGSADISLTVEPWLQFDWDGDGNYDNDPSATATFGISHGNDSTIYLRELY